MFENHFIEAVGEYKDIIRYEDGRVVETEWQRNKIVMNFCVLVSALLKEEPGYSGLQYWSVGSGEETWDIPSVFEVAQLVVNSGATVSGTVTISLNGVGTAVSVTAGDTATVVATKIRNANYAGWTTGGSGTTISFTATTDGNKINASFLAGSTGVSASMLTIVDGVTGHPRPDPSVNDTGCLNEIARVAIPSGNIQFVDSNGQPTATPTNRLQVALVFGEGVATGNWREFCIMGGNATATLGTGLAINRRTHGMIEKTETMIIERIIRFTFS